MKNSILISVLILVTFTSISKISYAQCSRRCTADLVVVEGTVRSGAFLETINLNTATVFSILPALRERNTAERVGCERARRAACDTAITRALDDAEARFTDRADLQRRLCAAAMDQFGELAHEVRVLRFRAYSSREPDKTDARAIEGASFMACSPQTATTISNTGRNPDFVACERYAEFSDEIETLASSIGCGAVFGNWTYAEHLAWCDRRFIGGEPRRVSNEVIDAFEKRKQQMQLCIARKVVHRRNGVNQHP